MVKLENDTPEDRQALKEALDYVSNDPAARKIIEGMERKDVTIHMVHRRTKDEVDKYDGGNNTIYWEPKASLGVEDDQGKTIGVRSAAVLLMHEGAHATDPNFTKHLNTPNAQYEQDADAYAVGKEDQIARTLGEPIRLNHRGGFIAEADPTEHTHTDPDGTARWVEMGGKSLAPYVPGTKPLVAPSAIAGQNATAPAVGEGWRSFNSGSNSPAGQIGQEMKSARAFVQQLQQKNSGGAEQAAASVTRDLLVRAWQNEGRD